MILDSFRYGEKSFHVWKTQYLGIVYVKVDVFQLFSIYKIMHIDEWIRLKKFYCS